MGRGSESAVGNSDLETTSFKKAGEKHKIIDSSHSQKVAKLDVHQNLYKDALLRTKREKQIDKDDKSASNLTKKSTSRTQFLYEDAAIRANKLRVKIEEKAEYERQREAEALKLLEIPPPPPPRRKDESENKSSIRKSSGRSQLLYEDAKYRQIKIQERREEDTKTTCSFSPTITKKAHKMKSQGSRFFSLYDNAARIQAKIEEKRKEKEKVIFTFQPKINKKKIRKRPESKYSTESNDRIKDLYEKALSRKERIERKREEILKNECTFEPKINQTSYNVPRKNLYPSRESLLLAKKAQMDKKMKRELKDCTFEPKRIASDQWLESNALQHLSVYERNYFTFSIIEEKKKVLREERKLKEMEACTFEPALATKSGNKEDMSHNKTIAASQSAACERLYGDAERIQTKLEKYRKEVTLGETNGFMPNLSTQPNRREKIYFNQERIEELHCKGTKQVKNVLKSKEKRHSLLEKQDAEDEKECTFQPNTEKLLSENSKCNSEASAALRFERLYQDAFDSAKRLEEKKQEKQQIIKNCANTVFTAASITNIDDTLSQYESDIDLETSSKLSERTRVNHSHFENLYQNAFEKEQKLEMRRKLEAKIEDDAHSFVFSAKSIASFDDEMQSQHGSSVSASLARTEKVSSRHLEKLYQNAFQIEFKREQERKMLDENAKKSQNLVFSANTIAEFDRRRRSKSLSPKKGRRHCFSRLGSPGSPRGALTSIWEQVEALETTSTESVKSTQAASLKNSSVKQNMKGLLNLANDINIESKANDLKSDDKETTLENDLKEQYVTNALADCSNSIDIPSAQDLIDLLP